MSDSPPCRSRREILSTLAVAGSFAWLGAHAQAADIGPSRLGEKKPPSVPEEEVAPGEDLMREHGVLNRILLIYEEGIRRSENRLEIPDRALRAAAGIIQRFIESYHEKLEEEHLFPRFEKAGRMVELVSTLRSQHQAGRRVTAAILELTASVRKEPSVRARLREELKRFVRMYRPHEAREDTVLFPEFRNLVSSAEYERLGEQFEEKEHQLLGERGFERIVEEVAGLEKALGIYELAQFTPRV
jgi:hemerythrin-like domain-containing protein